MMKNVREVFHPMRMIPVHGNIPTSLKGKYYRCGPGMFDEYGQRVNHPFDGDGYVSKVLFPGGGSIPTYAARIVDTNHRKREKKAGKRLYSGLFGTPPTGKTIKNATNASVVSFGGSLLVFYDSGVPYVVDPDTLETRQVLRPFQEDRDAVCAHPKVMNGTLTMMSVKHHKESTVVSFHDMKDGPAKMAASSSIPGFCYFHDFSVTEDYFVYIETPMSLNTSMMNMLGLASAIKCDTNRHGRIHIIEKKTKKEVVMDVPFGFTTHHVRCYQTPSKVVVMLDCIWYSHGFNLQAMGHNKSAQLCRIVADLQQKQASFGILRDEWMELPVTNSTSNIIYATAYQKRNVQDALVRVDNRMPRQLWLPDRDSSFEQPVVTDNDAWVMATCKDSLSGEMLLHVFDANDLSKGPLCSLMYPAIAPPALHACWMG